MYSSESACWAWSNSVFADIFSCKFIEVVATGCKKPVAYLLNRKKNVLSRRCHSDSRLYWELTGEIDDENDWDAAK